MGEAEPAGAWRRRRGLGLLPPGRWEPPPLPGLQAEECSRAPSCGPQGRADCGGEGGCGSRWGTRWEGTAAPRGVDGPWISLGAVSCRQVLAEHTARWAQCWALGTRRWPTRPVPTQGTPDPVGRMTPHRPSPHRSGRAGRAERGVRGRGTGCSQARGRSPDLPGSAQVTGIPDLPT